ncbi:MAG TPA: hypothetical protein VMG10_19080 [Gemmataceae bacterium]|nr:hypothetical protein [Gemmataceae bacterium]
MHRVLLLFVGVGLLGLLSGCHHCAGRCDCLVHPIDHGTPSPIVKPAPVVAPPVQPVAPSPAP